MSIEEERTMTQAVTEIVRDILMQCKGEEWEDQEGRPIFFKRVSSPAQPEGRTPRTRARKSAFHFEVTVPHLDREHDYRLAISICQSREGIGRETTEE